MAAANSGGSGKSRPISPHLSVYRMTNSMLMSILHRITGGALYFGTLLLAAWLIAAAVGPDAFAHVQRFFGSWFGKFVLLGYTWALMHHMLGGIRHLIWDTGRGFNLSTVNILSNATIIGSLLLTAVIWFFALKGTL